MFHKEQNHLGVGVGVDGGAMRPLVALQPEHCPGVLHQPGSVLGSP